VIRLSVPFRQALSRLTLPVMLMFSLGLVLIGRADQTFSDHLQIGLDDLLAPAYQLVDSPIEAVEHGGGMVGHLFDLDAENARLRAENATLLQWQGVAMALEAQNAALKASLNYVPSPAPHFFTGNVVADLGGVYAWWMRATARRGCC
jgi:rod shape-determining protein MreC